MNPLVHSMQANAGIFDAIFDDVYQKPEYVAALGGTEPVTPEDLKVSLALAAVFGPKSTLPGRFLIDHLPLIDLCCNPSWQSLAVKVIQPACTESNLIAFLDNCAGVVFMSSNSDEQNNLVKEMREKGDLEGAGKYWRKHNARAAEVIDIFKTNNVRPVELCPAAPYSTFIADHVRDLGLPPGPRSQLEGVQSRGAAFFLTKKLRESGELDEAQSREAIRAAIMAKHEEVTVQLGATRRAWPTPRIQDECGRDRRGIREVDFPALGALVKGDVGPAALVALLGDNQVDQLRANWLVAFASGDMDDFVTTLERLCTRAAAILDVKRNESSVRGLLFRASMFAGGMMGLAGLKSILGGDPTMLDFAFLFAGGVVILESVTPRPTSLWAELHCHPKIYEEVREFGQRQG